MSATRSASETTAAPLKAPPPEGRMSFLQHLEELRSRLTKSVIAFVIGTIACWGLREKLLAFVAAPFVDAWRRQHLGPRPMLHWASPIDAWMGYLKLSLLGGLFLASPVLLFQLWRFVSPGLYSRERRFVVPFVLFGTFFFVGGAAFGYRVVFPLGFQYFFSFAGPVAGTALSLQPTIMLDEYLSFASQILVAFGVTFELPILTTFLAVAGIVNYRQLWRFGRWFVVIAAIVAAVLTPPDLGSMIMMLIPLLVLYLLSVGLAFLLGKRPPPAKAPPV